MHMNIVIKALLLLVPLLGLIGMDNTVCAGKVIMIYDYGSESSGKRPFSWYYPYSYQYYYPRRGHDSCYWIYTPQGYLYQCN